MDRDFESDNLDMFIDWNDDEFQPTFLQTDTPGLTGLEDANLMEQFNSQFDLPPLPSTSFQTMVETTEPTSWSHEGSSSAAAALTFVPNPLPPLPNTPLLQATPISNPLSSADELMIDGAVPSRESQEVTLTGYLNELADLQNENSVAHQAIHLAQNPINQVSVPNRIENNIINQSSSYPALVHPKPNPARPGNESGYSSGQLAPPQRPELFPLHNHISNSTVVWNYRPSHINSSAPDAYGAQYAANFTQSPQSFTTVHNQVGSHASELQQLAVLRSQNSVRPVYPTWPRSEAYTNFQPALTRMPTNPFQQGYRPVLPDPASPFGSSLANYAQNPILQATRGFSFASGSSLHSTYGPLFGNQDRGQHPYPQVRMPNAHGQQSSASVQQWLQISEYNQRMMNPNLQRQINTVGSQTLISGILGHSSTRTTEVTSSRVPNSREAEIAQVLRMQQEATLSTNEVQTSRDTGKRLATSSTGIQNSETLQRILNMNSARSAGLNTRFITEQISNSMPTERVPYVPPRRGRPPKRRDLEGPSSSQPRKSQKVSRQNARGGTSVAPQGSLRTPESVIHRDQNAIPNPLSASSHFLETAYDMEFEMQGRPLDPKLFKPPPGN